MDGVRVSSLGLQNKNKGIFFYWVQLTPKELPVKCFCYPDSLKMSKTSTVWLGFGLAPWVCRTMTKKFFFLYWVKLTPMNSPLNGFVTQTLKQSPKPQRYRWVLDELLVVAKQTQRKLISSLGATDPNELPF